MSIYSEKGINLYQDKDCCDGETPSGDCDLQQQKLNIRIMDGGGGPYLVFKTKRFAIGEIDKFCEFLKSLEKVCIIGENITSDEPL